MAISVRITAKPEVKPDDRCTSHTSASGVPSPFVANFRSVHHPSAIGKRYAVQQDQSSALCTGTSTLLPDSSKLAASLLSTRQLSAGGPGEIRSRRLHRTCSA